MHLRAPGLAMLLRSAPVSANPETSQMEPPMGLGKRAGTRSQAHTGATTHSTCGYSPSSDFEEKGKSVTDHRRPTESKENDSRYSTGGELEAKLVPFTLQLPGAPSSDKQTPMLDSNSRVPRTSHHTALQFLRPLCSVSAPNPRPPQVQGGLDMCIPNTATVSPSVPWLDPRSPPPSAPSLLSTILGVSSRT